METENLLRGSRQPCSSILEIRVALIHATSLFAIDGSLSQGFRQPESGRLSHLDCETEAMDADLDSGRAKCLFLIFLFFLMSLKNVHLPPGQEPSRSLPADDVVRIFFNRRASNVRLK